METRSWAAGQRILSLMPPLARIALRVGKDPQPLGAEEGPETPPRGIGHAHPAKALPSGTPKRGRPVVIRATY